MPNSRCSLPLVLALGLVLAACGGSDTPVGTAPGPTCDPTIAISPTLVTLTAGANAALTAKVTPCGVARKTAFVATDTAIAKVAATSDTTAVVTGVRTGNTTVLASVAAFPGANAVVVVQVQ